MSRFCPSYAVYSVTVSCRIALFSAISIGPTAFGLNQSIQPIQPIQQASVTLQCYWFWY